MTDRKRSASLDWEDVRVFATLARHHTLAATARTLKVTQAAVARRLSHLESTVGRALVTRKRAGVALTAAGVAALAQAEQMEFAASALSLQREGADEIEGRVRITIARLLADGFLAERIGGLAERHPQLEIETHATSKNLSLARHEAEIALRFARPASGELLVRRLATIDYGFYASPRQARDIATGSPPRFIAFDDASDFVPEAAWARRFLADKCIVFRANTQSAQAAAARGGAGIALLPGIVARAGGDLVPVDFAERPPPRELWMLMRPDVARVPRVRAVADHLLTLFDEQGHTPIPGNRV